MSVIAGITPEGKRAALQPAFTLMAEMTGAQAQTSKSAYYANYFHGNHIAIADVNTAVAELMGSWQKPYWPSPEIIGARAREIGARRAFQESPRQLQSVEVEQNTMRARDQRWAERVEEAEFWCNEHPEESLLIAQEVEKDIQRMVGSGRAPKMAENRLYRDAWREGAMIGTVLRKKGEAERKAIRLKELSQRISQQTIDRSI